MPYSPYTSYLRQTGTNHEFASRDGYEAPGVERIEDLKILITAARSPLPRLLAHSLEAAGHEIRLTERADLSPLRRFVPSDLDHTAATNELVRGMDAIIHPGDVDPGASVSEQLDYQMRCTYNLLWAAVEESVPRFIYLSSLILLDGYHPAYAVTERWKTTPTTDAPALCYHLGEIVCREFAREGRIRVTVLRLGEITSPSNTDPSTSALYEDDAAQAVDKALTCEHSGWLDIHHVQSAVPGARFLVGQPWWSADDFPPVSLGYTPAQRD